MRWPWSSDVDRILSKIDLLKGELKANMADLKTIHETLMEDITTALETLQSKVQATEDAEASAELLLKGLSDQLKALGDQGATAAQIMAFAAKLDAGASTLAKAVVDNTPAATPA